MKQKLTLLFTFSLCLILVACGNSDVITEVETGSTEEVSFEEEEVVEAGEVETIEEIEEEMGMVEEEDDTEEGGITQEQESVESPEPERVQPQEYFGDIDGLKEFANSLGLEELVLLYYDDDENLIVYDEDDFQMDEIYITLALFSYKAMTEVTFVPEVELLSYSEYVYAFSVDSYKEQDLTIHVGFADGTEEEFNVHLIPE